MSSVPAPAAGLDTAAALRELTRREGRMAELCSEHGALRMDWVDSVEALLADPRALREVEDLAEEWRRRGVRHVIWAGMGGSGVTVAALAELAPPAGGMTVHLLDSTDPAAIDALLARLDGERLEDVVLVAVSMGISSEEPATHLAWFLGLLAAQGLPAAEHAVVLTVPGSRLEEAAEREGIEARPVFLGGRGGLPGRMSAPGTAVFLLPAALRSEEGRLRELLSDAWSAHDLGATAEDPDRSPYVRLAAEVAARAPERARLLLALPPGWSAMRTWIEQLFEQTLGKDDKGVVVFEPQRLNPAAPSYRDDDLIVLSEEEVPVPGPSLEPGAAFAAAALGWQLTVALLGHRAGTNIVDEPAVEDYKSRASELRERAHVLARAVEEGALDWAAMGADGLEPLVEALVTKARERRLSYLDVTLNGELGSRAPVTASLRRLGNDLLGVPVKLRRAPAAYHVSEQCQLDGPPGVVSLRMVARSTRPARHGAYAPSFLHAQAVATWQAMTARGRDCALVVLDRLEEVADVLAAAERMTGARIEGRTP
jgi:hypothetical protein